MEMALCTNHFSALSNIELLEIEGGKSFWTYFTGVCTIVAGGAAIVGGVCGLLAPEPTGLTKVAGWAGVVGGVATIGAGIGTMC